jgi:mono/diheme cytochrome c family protein
MIVNIVSVLVLVAFVVLFAWLTKRAWGSKRKILKWPALVLSGLLTLVLALVTVVALIGLYKLSAPQGNPVATIKVAGTSEQIARGAKFAVFCAGCHSTTGKPPLDGSKDDFISGPAAPPVGVLYVPNLTPAGETKDWSDGEIIRAIREGVHKSGRALLIMPSDQFHNLSDADVQSIVAYLRSQPAIVNKPQNDTPSNGLNLLGALFIGAGVFPTSVQPPITQPVVAPAEGPTADYGQYLVANIGCRACHGENLAGGKPGGFGPPPGPNITVLVPKWNEADFVKTIRTGVDPTGKSLNADLMPWKAISAFATDDDLKAIYAYLHGLTPVEKTAK